MECKNIYATSDIHGHYKALIEAISNSSFNSNNDLLVVCGDMFDRGGESLKVYEYLKGLYDNKRAVIIKGNHEQMFIDYLEGNDISPFNYIRNGLDETFAEFLHCTKPFETWCILREINNPTYGDFAEWVAHAREEINEEYPELLPWLKSLPYYFETEDYIFTHGAIDTEVEDWKNPMTERYGKTDWEALMWDDGSFFGKTIRNTDKSVVIGHFGTNHLRKMYNIVDNSLRDNYNILCRDDGKVVALDSTVVVSGRLNCGYFGEQHFEEEGLWN